MIHTKDLEKIVALALCSAYVKGDKPLSLLIISDRPEAGKTDTVKQFIGTPYVEFATDISGYGIKRDFAEKISRGELKHIVIPEMLQPLMKGKIASQTFITTLQVAMEDGIMGLHTGFIVNRNTPVQDSVKTVGFIGCLPRLAYTKGIRYEWLKLGFLSRWVVITYKYSDAAIDSILESIRNGDYLTPSAQELSFDGEMIDIILPDDVGLSCEKVALEITKEAREQGLAYGFREVKHIRSLVAANVIYDRIVNGNIRGEATMDDFNEVDRLGYLFNEQFNEVIK